jgi:MraZ protein
MRNEAGGRLYVLKGYEGSLAIYKEEDFQRLTLALENLPYNQRDSRDVQRIALASVTELEVDAQGRIQLPSRLLTDYKISRSVVVIGVINHFEIWDASAWEKYLQQNEKEYEAKAEKLPVQ